MRGKAVEEDEEGRRRPAPDSVEAWANEAGVHVGAAESLRSKLSRLMNRPYLVNSPASNGLAEIIDSLQAGRHVILSFGRFDSELDYLLVTNLITRKIRDSWEAATNQYHKDKKVEPRPLVVVSKKPTLKLAQPRDGIADDFQHHRAGNAKILCNPADHRPAPLANL